ncbi:MAG: hypothetical protein IEMM0002_1234 [bacterium]|nr:MAG: hypothetical protein IEMM0002_1234 [bacterium]
MAYSTTQDVKDRISEDTLVQLTDTTNSGQVDDTLVQSAIADADSLIDSLISPVYQVPLSSVPRIIKERSAIIAIFKLHLFRSVNPGVWKDAYLGALEFLQSVAAGKATLEGSAPEPPATSDLSSNVDFESSDRKFSRDELKEW